MPRAEPSRARARQTDPASRPGNGTPVDNHPEAYLFRVHVKDVSDPTVERYLYVPCDYSFQRFATVLQIAFGWGEPGPLSRFAAEEMHYWAFELSADRPLRNVGLHSST